MIGLVTCFLDNYGACLQAYALQKTIEKSGNKVEIIKYIGEVGYAPDTGLRKLIRNPFFKWVKRRLSKEYDEYCKRRVKFDSFRKKHLHFSERSFYSFDELERGAQFYDAYVCGSDQIWNPMLYNGNNRVYFLDFVPEGKRRIAYAPSIGVSEIPVEYQLEMTQLLQRMDVLSTREETGAGIVKMLSGRDCRTVLDPTLLLSGEEWSCLAKKPNIDRPYIFCYLFGERNYIGEFLDYVIQKTGFQVVTIPFTKREENTEFIQERNAGPEEFVGLIKNASLVITDSFHATAFSINLNTPFYSLLRNNVTDSNNMNSRITDILGMLDLQERLIEKKEDFPVQIDLDVNFDSVNEVLNQLRREDKEFLYKSI